MREERWLRRAAARRSESPGRQEAQEAPGPADAACRRRRRRQEALSAAAAQARGGGGGGGG